jgi:hypothetical protein
MATTARPSIGAPSARQGKAASRGYRKGDWIITIRSPGRWWSSAFEGLEPYEGKLSRTVLRGAWAGNGPGLPGLRHEVVS